MDSGVVRFEVGEADSERSLRPGHRTGLGSQARRNKGPEKTLLLAGGEGGISPLQL